MARRFSEREKEDIQRARAEGAGTSELARIYGVRQSTISWICSGIEPKSDGNEYEHVSGAELLSFLAEWLPAHPNEGLALPRWLVRYYGIRNRK